MLEPDALHGIGELDIDAEIVGIQLQPVVGPEPPSSATSIASVATPVERQTPVPVRSGDVSNVTGAATICSTQEFSCLVSSRRQCGRDRRTAWTSLGGRPVLTSYDKTRRCG